MVKLYESGAFLAGGELFTDEKAAAAKCGKEVSAAEAKKGTIAYGILTGHNKSDNDKKLNIRFDKLTSHDITFVGIIQTARAS